MPTCDPWRGLAAASRRRDRYREPYRARSTASRADSIRTKPRSRRSSHCAVIESQDNELPRRLSATSSRAHLKFLSLDERSTMQWFGKALGSILGFAAGGPLGSLLGLALGH